MSDTIRKIKELEVFKMKSKYLITSDMDNTLLKTNKDISFKTRFELRRLVREGHHFSLNTGRPYQATLTQYHQLKLYNEPIIVNNGAAIVFLNKNNKIEKSITFPIKREFAINFLKKIKAYLKCAFASSLQTIYMYNREFIPFFIIHLHEDIRVLEGPLDETIDEDLLSIELNIKEEYIDEVNQILEQEEFKYAFSKIFWGKFNDVYSIQISSPESGKGKAMLYLADYYGIAHENTIAFGDNLNDNEMIEMAGIGVAMNNSREETKKIAKSITTYDFDHHGVAHFLKKHFKSIK